MNSGKSQTLNLLTEIHKGCQMGIDAIDFLINKVTDDNFRKDLVNFQTEYKSVASKANEEIKNYGGIPREIGVGTQLGTWAATNIQTLFNSSSEHIAEMMTKGIDMGIQGINKAIQDNVFANEYAKNLGKEFVSLQHQHESKIKEYMH